MQLETFDGYIEKVPNISFDINALLHEYVNIVEPNLQGIEFNHHKELRCVWNNEPLDVLNLTKETQQAIKVVSEFFIFDTVIWRQIDPMRAYHWHMDEGKLNYHIPIVTNPGCWFVYAGKSFQMHADGSIYKVNNHRYHTFVNAGHKPRAHLIFENNFTDIQKLKELQNLKSFFTKK